ncbi:MAG: hypothetical protein WC508_02060 [Patescibacteria group bacterium]
MPTKTKKTKTSSAKKSACCSNWEEELGKLGEQLLDGLKTAKKKYDQLDVKTRKEIVMGVAGAVTLLAGARMVKKIGKKKK